MAGVSQLPVALVSQVAVLRVHIALVAGAEYEVEAVVRHGHHVLEAQDVFICLDSQRELGAGANNAGAARQCTQQHHQ